ncbi:MAG: ECF transporter S component [Clostridia bacterium]|nr:ECF transporter S component [Clostridia bacterium]
MSKMSTRNLVLAAILTALVIILQFLGAFIKLGPFSISAVLVPIVIGAATCGVGIGAWLGLVFGIVVILSGDAALFLAVNVPGTIITVILKGTLCGFCAGVVYKLLARYNRYVAVAAAAVVCPLVNTGVFLLGCLVFFMQTVAGWAEAAGLGGNLAQYMIFGLVGANFLVEMGINIILSPVIVRLLNIKQK